MFEAHAIRTIIGEPGRNTGERVAKSTVGMLPLAAFLIGAVLLIAGGAGAGLGMVTAGLAFTAAGSVLAVATAILYAWIVLVEVLRSGRRRTATLAQCGRGMYHSVYSVARPLGSSRMTQRFR